MLQKLAEWFLGIPPADPGQGTAWKFGHNFPWPPWVTLLFALLAAAYVTWVYQRDAGHLSRLARLLLVSLRLAAIAVLLFILSEAFLAVERTGLPYLVILLDRSASMATEDAPTKSASSGFASGPLPGKSNEKPTRLNLSKRLLAGKDGEFLKSLLENHKLRLYTVAETESPIGSGDALRPADVDKLLPELRDLEPRGDQTRLGRLRIRGHLQHDRSCILVSRNTQLAGGFIHSDSRRQASAKDPNVLIVHAGQRHRFFELRSAIEADLHGLGFARLE